MMIISKIKLRGLQLVRQLLPKFQISYARGDPFKPIEVTVSQMLTNIAERFPSNKAVISPFQSKSLNYTELLQKSLQLADAILKVFKLPPKSRIGIYSYNCWEWYVLQLAAAHADLILVNINPAYRSDELFYTLDKVQVEVLFFRDKFKKSNYLKIVGELFPNGFHQPCPKLPHLKSCVVIESEPGQSELPAGVMSFNELLEKGNPSRSRLPNTSTPDSPANIQFTSGTTGRPKAATLSHINIINNGFIIGENCNYSEADNIALAVPLYHCFGMIMGNLGMLVRGGTVTYPNDSFDPEKTLEACSSLGCTAIYGVPTMFLEYLRILNHLEQRGKKLDLTRLRTGIIAGALAPEILMKDIMSKLGVKQITNCYGMTETSPVSFQTHPEDEFVKKTTTVGKVLPGLEAKLVKNDGRIAAKGEAGEFCLKGWAVMLGYWGDEDANKKSIKDGWMHSGDLGQFDEEMYLSIVGRIKDMIIRGGENVYPKEIEEHLRSLPGVMDIQVVGVSDEKFGEEIAAVIRTADGSGDKLAVLAHCKDKIAHYKIPKYVKFVTELPMTVTGKPQKYLLREEL